MSHYIVIPRIQVRNANAQPVWWVIGAPPVTAYVGFAQALALHLNAGSHDGIAVVHHDIQFLGETTWNVLLPHQFRAASFIDKDDYSSKNAHALSSQPTARCHLTVSVVIRFGDDASFSGKAIAPFLRGGRLAGGTIIEHGKPVVLADEDDIDKVAKVVGAGFSLIERQDLMVQQDGDRDMLDVLLRLTKPAKKRDDDLHWLLPTTLGYAEITPRQQRKNVRGDFAHAYCEPLVGLVQYRSIRDVGLQFWRFTHPLPSVFAASTK
jgi:CRISPR-associated protein Csy2